jgi:hypothetical protein
VRYFWILAEVWTTATPGCGKREEDENGFGLHHRRFRRRTLPVGVLRGQWIDEGDLPGFES